MISLVSWYEDGGSIERLLFEVRFCFNAKPRSIEIKLPDNDDGMHNSIMIPIGDLIKVLTDRKEI